MLIHCVGGSSIFGRSIWEFIYKLSALGYKFSVPVYKFSALGYKFSVPVYKFSALGYKFGVPVY